MKIRDELKERLWVPGLVVNQAAEGIVGLINRKKTEYKSLKMDRIPECGEIISLQGQKLLRPHLARASFFSLDGVWRIANSSAANIPTDQAFFCHCRVPYAPEAALSEFDGEKLSDVFWYKRQFQLPEGFVHTQTDRILLHFGAVDQIAEVFIDGQFVTKHEGGYLPFEMDITEYLGAFKQAEYDNRMQNKIYEICVRVTDSLNPDYPYGKQSRKRGGMWYTPVSGIWQSVWLECVPAQYIRNVTVHAQNSGEAELLLTVCQAAEVIDKDASISEIRKKHPVITRVSCGKKILESGQDYEVLSSGWREDSTYAVQLRVKEPELWSVAHPNLYEMRISFGTDEIETYFAFREVKIEMVNQRNRITLNGKPVFLQGVLDQGYFSDGIYTPGSPLWYLDDILHMKELGFNTLRKHIKIEPECFYYFCDKYGMLVMQDMVNAGAYSFARDTALPTFVPLRADNRKIVATKKQRDFFIHHCEETIEQLAHHPSICYYTIFNEGWGQFESDRIYGILKKKDGSRIFDSTSGWFMQKESDVYSIHTYYHRFHMPLSTERAVILSECGGYSYKITEHSFNQTDRYGYGDCEDAVHLTDRICHLYEKEVMPAIARGLCGCIYTQLSDVEDETNGFYTYDRKCCKVEKQRIRRVNQKLMHVFDVAVRI